jgi:glycosyltransferase involved in cell wall biosynthesis
MRILIFSQYFWPENFHINDIACDLKARGHEIEVMTGKPNYPDGKFFSGYSSWGIDQELWKDIPIYRLPIFARGSKSKFKLVLNSCSFIVSGFLLAPWLLRRAKYDVIFVYGVSPIFQAIPASFLGWLKRAPVVLWIQDLWPQSAEALGYVKSPIFLKLLGKFVRFTYAHTDLLLVQSKAFMKPVAELAPNISSVYYPNSVGKVFYSPKDIIAPYIESLQSDFTVLFAGNIGEAQSMKTILAAAEKLQKYTKIKIVILGSGSKLEWMTQQISNKKLTNLYLEGRFPIETMPILMRQASVLLVTLTNQPIFELTVPNKIQAYLAVGKPVIACLNGEGARLINEANAGIAVKAEDSDELEQAIVKLYQMSEPDRDQMGSNGRAYFRQHFDGEMLTSQLIEHFEKLTLK